MADGVAAGSEGNGVQRQLGILIGQMGEVLRRQDEADESRRRTHERIDGLAREFTEMRSEMRGELRSFSDRLGQSEKVMTAGTEAIERFERYEAGGKAAVSVITVMGRPLGTILKGAVLAAAAIAIVAWREILSALTGGGPAQP